MIYPVAGKSHPVMQSKSKNLRCEHMEDPLGIDAGNVRFYKRPPGYHDQIEELRVYSFSPSVLPIMKLPRHLLGSVALCLSFTVCTAPIDALQSGFLIPPDYAKLQTWWHWIDGNEHDALQLSGFLSPVVIRTYTKAAIR
jgi:hypothetical protein